jgi:hypothetical protein
VALVPRAVSTTAHRQPSHKHQDHGEVVWLQGDGMTVGLAWWATGALEDWEGLNPCRPNDRAYLAERGASMSVFRPGVDAVSVLRGSRQQQVCAPPSCVRRSLQNSLTPAHAAAEPALPLTAVGWGGPLECGRHQDEMLPLTASDPPLLLTLVAFQQRGDQVVRSPARVVRRFHGCVRITMS